MYVNNEVGTILDIQSIGGRLCHKHNALFHSDTVQVVGHFPLNLGDLPIDFAAAAAHKFHGPKGVGFMYARSKTGLGSLLMGGAQEEECAQEQKRYTILWAWKWHKLAYESLSMILLI